MALEESGSEVGAACGTNGRAGRLRAEYLEMPGMKLRIDQVQRLCGIEQTMCKIVLDALVKTTFLCLKSDGMYVRLTDGSSPRPHAIKAVVTSTPIVMTSRRAS
jgi:hypothetical protein